MDIQKLEEMFKQLSPQQRTELNNLLGRIDLATNINKDPDFMEESLQMLFEEYPQMRNLI